MVRYGHFSVSRADFVLVLIVFFFSQATDIMCTLGCRGAADSTAIESCHSHGSATAQPSTPSALSLRAAPHCCADGILVALAPSLDDLRRRAPEPASKSLAVPTNTASPVPAHRLWRGRSPGQPLPVITPSPLLSLRI